MKRPQFDKSGWSEIISQHLAKGLDFGEISDAMGISRGTLTRYLFAVRFNGYDGTKGSYARARARALEPRLRELAALSYNAEDIGPKIGITPTLARSYMRRLGIPFVTNNRKIYKFDKTGWEKDVLPWYRAGKDLEWIAKKKGTSKCTIYRWLCNDGHHQMRERCTR